MLDLLSAQFLRDNGKADSDSIMRAKATVAFHNQNFKVTPHLIIISDNTSSLMQELYTILETREFESRYHHELQEMWYRAHYHEAEKIRARPLGECYTSPRIVINKELNFNKSADKSAR